MKLSDRQKCVLANILLDRDRLASLTPRYQRGDTAALRERDDIAQAKQGKVRGNPSKWFGGEMTPSVYAMTSRCYLQLHTKGLVMRHACGYSPDVTTHLSLTADGERVAKDLLGVDASGFCVTGALPRDMPAEASSPENLSDVGKEKLPPSAALRETGAEQSPSSRTLSDA